MIGLWALLEAAFGHGSRTGWLARRYPRFVEIGVLASMVSLLYIVLGYSGALKFTWMVLVFVIARGISVPILRGKGRR